MASDRVSRAQDQHDTSTDPWAAVHHASGGPGAIVPPGQEPPPLPGMAQLLKARLAASGVNQPLLPETDTVCGKQRNLDGFAEVGGWIYCGREPHHEGLCKGAVTAANGETIVIVWGGPRNVRPMRVRLWLPSGAAAAPAPASAPEAPEKPQVMFCGARFHDRLGGDDRICTLPPNHENIYHLDQTRADEHSLGFKWWVAVDPMPAAWAAPETDASRCRAEYSSSAHLGAGGDPQQLKEVVTRCQLREGHTGSHQGSGPYGSTQWLTAPEFTEQQQPAPLVSTIEEIAALRRQLEQERATKEQALALLRRFVYVSVALPAPAETHEMAGYYRETCEMAGELLLEAERAP